MKEFTLWEASLGIGGFLVVLLVIFGLQFGVFYLILTAINSLFSLGLVITALNTLGIQLCFNVVTFALKRIRTGV